MSRALSAKEVAAEFGKSADWLYGHWPRLVKEKRLPRPISGLMGSNEALKWNSAQVFAYLDRDLPAAMKTATAAHRAAALAAQEACMNHATDHAIDVSVADAAMRLDQRFGKGHS
jgi:predicted DNA-binding transcriptional regulator AlpA